MAEKQDLDFGQHSCPDCTQYHIYDSARGSVQFWESRAADRCPLAEFVTKCIHWIASNAFAIKQSDVLNVCVNGRVECCQVMKDYYLRYLVFEYFQSHRLLRQGCVAQHVATKDISDHVPLDFETIPGTNSTAPSDLLRLLPRTTSSAATFETVSQWLTECCSSHADCLEPGSVQAPEQFEGLRFLRIDESRVYVVENAQPIRYAALSYCWGSGLNVLKTYRATLDEHCTLGIPLCDLPLLFQDTVRVCRRLTIEYLWIDSLCIIQDELQDWSEQASRMSQVYENSLITIAASKASDPSQSLFSEVHPSFQGEALPDVPGMWIRQVCAPPGTDFRTYHSPHDPWPLFKRAWVYQEFTLSPRVVHFGTQEVIWHCTTVSKRPQSMSRIFEDRSGKVKHKKFNTDSYRQQWYRTIEAYSWRHLTFHSDKLPAIAAIARNQQKFRPTDQYLAGIWKETLLYDLLWSAEPETERGFPASSKADVVQHKVPSWSWAATIRGVTWPALLPSKPLRTLVVTNTIYITQGPVTSGIIQKAAIELIAPLIRVGKLPCLPFMEFRRQEAIVECQNSPIGNSMFELVRSGITADYYEPETFNDDVYAVPLLIQSYEEMPSLHATSPTGRTSAHPGELMLVVEKSEGQNECKRIGVVNINLRGAFCLPDANGSPHDSAVDILHARNKYRNHLIDVLESMETQAVTLV